MRYGRAALREGASKSLGGWSGEVAGSGIRQVGTCQITEGLINAVYRLDFLLKAMERHGQVFKRRGT